MNMFCRLRFYFTGLAHYPRLSSNYEHCSRPQNTRQDTHNQRTTPVHCVTLGILYSYVIKGCPSPVVSCFRCRVFRCSKCLLFFSFYLFIFLYNSASYDVLNVLCSCDVMNVFLFCLFFIIQLPMIF